jgi:hypothetical protein
MTQPTLQGRLLSPAGFALALLCFLLPFVAVSCGSPDDQVTATFTGVDMVVGSAPEITGTGLNADDVATLHALVSDEYDLEPLALFAALAIMAGMASTLLPRLRARYTTGTALAAVAFALVILAELRTMSRLENFRGSLLLGADAIAEPGVASFRLGFWLTVVLLAGLVAGHAVALRRTPNAEPVCGPPPPAGALPGGAPPGPGSALDEGLFFGDPDR